jgi:hypothetical protein
LKIETEGNNIDWTAEYIGQLFEIRVVVKRQFGLQAPN